MKWETTGRANFGLDARLLNNRVNVGFNVYKSWTRNLLMLKSLNFLSGLDSNWSNDGKLENTGFDVSLSGKILALKDFQWEAGATLGHYKNKVTALADGAQAMQQTLYGATIRSEVGKAANLFYGYKTSGVFATSDEAQQAGLYILDANGVTKHYFQAGDMRFDDADGNHEINEKDMTVIGDPNPDIYGNLFTAVAYKRFRLEARFNYSVGNDVYNYMRSQLEGGGRFMNQTTALNSRWQAARHLPGSDGQQPLLRPMDRGRQLSAPEDTHAELRPARELYVLPGLPVLDSGQQPLHRHQVSWFRPGVFSYLVGYRSGHRPRRTASEPLCGCRCEN